MFPKHCSEVCFKEVSFPLTRDNIRNESVGKIVFHNTKYLILTNGREWATARVHTAGQRFKRIERVEIVSLPENTGIVKDPTVNVNNPSLMMRKAEQEGKETVVVLGEFEHISFIQGEKPVPLAVFDWVPPHPSKLMLFVERALDTGRIRKPIRIVADILDLNKLARDSEKPVVMFPCYTGGIDCGKKTLVLVGTPDISSIGIGNMALIGCDATLRTFRAVYGEKPVFIDMCPLHREEVLRRREDKCITRCCKVEKGHLIVGNTAYVSYDPTLSEVEEAILDLFGSESIRAPSYTSFPPIRTLSKLVAIMLRSIFRS